MTKRDHLSLHLGIKEIWRKNNLEHILSYFFSQLRKTTPQPLKKRERNFVIFSFPRAKIRFAAVLGHHGSPPCQAQPCQKSSTVGAPRHPSCQASKPRVGLAVAPGGRESRKGEEREKVKKKEYFWALICESHIVKRKSFLL